MNAGAKEISSREIFRGWSASEWITVGARVSLGALFIWMGLKKGLHPVDFLKLVRQYDVLPHHFALNLVAAALPWFEVFCGLLLLLGVAVRGAAAMLIAMLVPFTVLILLRGLTLHETSGVPLCLVKFDCGCGAGEVFVCRKISENALLLAASVWLLFPRKSPISLRHSLR